MPVITELKDTQEELNIKSIKQNKKAVNMKTSHLKLLNLRRKKNKSEQSLKDLWDLSNRPVYTLQESQKENREEKQAVNLFKEVTGPNFPNLTKDMDIFTNIRSLINFK